MNGNTIIFDFDGTIADSFDETIEIFYEITKRKVRLDDSEVARLRKLSLLQVARELRVPIWKGLLLHRQARTRQWQYRDEIRPFAGIADALKNLHEAGDHLFILTTNGSRNVEYFLQKYGLSQYFENVYAGIGLFRKKHALRKFARQHHLKPEACFYVGDESQDIDAAKQAGMKTVAVSWGYNDISLLRTKQPDLVVAEPKEFVSVFAVDNV